MSRDLLLLSLRYDIYHSRVPAPFVRVGCSITDFIPTPEHSFNVVLTEEKQPQSTGVVHIGRLYCDDTQCSTCCRLGSQVVAKVGFSSSDKEVLSEEHEIYTLLHEARVNSEDDWSVLRHAEYGEDEVRGTICSCPVVRWIVLAQASTYNFKRSQVSFYRLCG